MIKAGVVGWPIHHSRSPLIHGYWLEQHGIAGSYEKLAIAPEEFAGFVRSLRENEYAGCNVTIPHKEAAFSLADNVSEEARAVGAANLLWLQDGRVMASNTDTFGFVESLDKVSPGWRDVSGHRLVLGAGGAARAIIYGLLQSGPSPVVLTNRTRQRAQEIAQSLAADGERIRVIDWDERQSAIAGAGLVVNTTSLGLSGNPALEIELSSAPPDCVVSDIVYSPLETSLLSQARNRELRAVDGLWMLLYQAVPSFEAWFGVRPEVTRELRQMVEDDLIAERD
jgi:shikimate dehydrogenase